MVSKPSTGTRILNPGWLIEHETTVFPLSNQQIQRADCLFPWPPPTDPSLRFYCTIDCKEHYSASDGD
jgi:hypothetical protein